MKNWFCEHGVNVPPEKFAVMITTRHLISTPTKIPLSGLEIPIKKFYNHLEGDIDNKLLWNDHINYIKRRRDINIF